jgi:hypothetical protein
MECVLVKAIRALDQEPDTSALHISESSDLSVDESLGVIGVAERE